MVTKPARLLKRRNGLYTQFELEEKQMENFLEHDAAYCGTYAPTFQRKLLSTENGMKQTGYAETSVHIKCRQVQTPPSESQNSRRRLLVSLGNIHTK
jgi:hypothetical protein